ncbi:MAG: phage holin family protein [Sphingobacteriales bacterium]|nr:MAG: phage holin family protein [Sphingobacteriales bacterium]
MEETKETTQSIIDQLKEYVETRITLAKYKAVEKGTTFIADIIMILVVIIVAAVTFLFLSFTLALFLADVLHSYWQGFGIVAGFYLIIVFIILAAKTSLEKPIINGLIKKILK